MKRGTTKHPKMQRLARALDCPKLMAVGVMESLWHFAAQYCQPGDIGRYSDREIADAIDYDGDATQLVAGLREARWIDAHDVHRLVLHDWFEHADDAVHISLARSVRRFASGEMPHLTRLSTKEREEIEAKFCAHTKRTASARRAHRSAPKAPQSALPSPALPCPALPSPTKETAPSASAEVGGFGEFWKAYPRKTAKAAAERAWRSLTIAGTLPAVDVLLAAVTQAARSPGWQKDRGQFIPHPATWLTGRRWEDESPSTHRAATPKPPNPLDAFEAAEREIQDARAAAGGARG